MTSGMAGAARWGGTVFLLLIFLSGALQPANAHTRSQSASEWILSGSSVTGVFAIDRRRATLLHGLWPEGRLEDLLVRHLAGTIAVSGPEGPCPLEPPSILAATPSTLRVGLSAVCAAPPVRDSGESALETVLTIRTDAFFNLSASHLHIIRVVADDPHGAGETVLAETVLNGGRRVLEIGWGRTASGPSAWGQFFGSGLGHVLGGMDHLAFLVGLMLLAHGVRALALMITGFTLGHSITLALASFGVIEPHAAAVEALIGFTIAFAALEAAQLPHAARRRLMGVGAGLLALGTGAAILGGGSVLPPVVLGGLAVFLAARAAEQETGAGMRQGAGAMALTMAFGLVHGAGFAGSIRDLGLEPMALIAPLVAFNLGVEAAQVGMVLLVFAVAVLFRPLPERIETALRDGAVAGLLALGLFWFAARSVGA